jgi:hypothetical protein
MGIKSRCSLCGDPALGAPVAATRFAQDSLQEGDGFELLVPGRETVKPSWETGLPSWSFRHDLGRGDGRRTSAIAVHRSCSRGALASSGVVRGRASRLHRQRRGPKAVIPMPILAGTRAVQAVGRIPAITANTASALRLIAA